MARSRSSSRPQDPRRLLLEAGTALFAQKGYAATSVREIVARAGLTKPMLYYYFQSKEGLFRAILDEAAAQQEALLSEVREGSGPVLERLSDLYRRIYERASEYRDVLRLIYSLVFGPPVGAPAYDLDSFLERMLGTIRAMYQEGVARGEVVETEPETLSFLLVALLDFSIHLDLTHPEAADPERPVRMLRLVFAGLAGPEE